MDREKPVTFAVRVQPNAHRNEIVRYVESAWHIKIAAPAIEGKANAALVVFLSEVLDVSKTSLSIKLGARGRQKVVVVAGLTQDQVMGRLKKGMETNN